MRNFGNTGLRVSELCLGTMTFGVRAVCETNRRRTQAALNDLLPKPGVTSVISGVRTSDQLADDLNTVNWEMTSDEVARLDELSKPTRLYPYWMLEFTRQDRM